MIPKKIKKIGVVLAILMVAVVAFFLLNEFIANYIIRFNLSSIEAPGAGSRVLVVSPHNDDEVLGACEFIRKTISNGGKVKVVLVTNGDGYKRAIEFDYFDLHPKPQDYIKFGYTRQSESVNALKTLGLPEEDLLFLGYPDGGISRLWNSHWDVDDPYTSSYTQKSITPYTNSYTKGAVYAGESLSSDITKIIEEYKPTHIVYPHPNDRHPDHWAVNAFVKYVLTLTDYKPELELLYLVHRGDWPTPMKKNTNMYLVPPAKLIGTGTDWYALHMNSDDISEKSNTIHFYNTQIRTLGFLMSAFERKNELFGKYPDIKAVSHISGDEEIKPNINNRVIIDPLKDAIKLQMSEGADISALYAEISKDDNMHIFLETAGNIEKLTRYNINMVLFNDSRVSRINLQAEDNKLTAEYISKQSITDISSIKLEVTGRYIHVIIPYNVTGFLKNIFIGASSSIYDHLIDTTAWRMIDI